MTFALTPNLRGIVLMISAVSLFAMKDGFAKHLGGIYPILELLWTQYSLMLVIVFPIIVLRHGWKALWPSHIYSQISRGLMSIVAVGLFYFAITQIPLADAIALIFVAPIVVTALSPLLLGENVGIRRWVAVIAGFVGICFVVQPGFQDIELGTFASLGAGVIWAFFQITTRQLAQQEIPLVTVFCTSLIGAATTNSLLPFFWVTPTIVDGSMMLIMAGFASLGQALLIYAFVASPAVVIAPFVYVSIIVAVTIGYFVFGEFPTPAAWLGIFIVSASGVYIAIREAKVNEFSTRKLIWTP